MGSCTVDCSVVWFETESSLTLEEGCKDANEWVKATNLVDSVPSRSLDVVLKEATFSSCLDAKASDILMVPCMDFNRAHGPLESRG